MAVRKIWKYAIKVEDSQTLTLPKGSQILSVITQNCRAVVYAIVDTETKETEEYAVEIYGTGNEPIRHDDSYTFLGTIQGAEGVGVCHVFYKKK